jgi:beta-phosphoglucomutase-like phosphatase (HAD superfamily)
MMLIYRPVQPRERLMGRTPALHGRAIGSREVAKSNSSQGEHDDADRCDCRKPKPGLLLRAADRWGVDLPSSWMIGDRAGDVGAGRAAGCRTIFIDLGHDEPKPDPPADYVCGSLPSAVHIIKGVTVHDDRRQRFEGQIVR